MRTAALLLLLLAAAATGADTPDNTTNNGPDDTLLNNTLTVDKKDLVLANDTRFNANDTLTDESDGDHEPVVRKKRTFGDIVFRGLADVLGYNVAPKPPQAAFPPPLAPVPGIDAPLQAGSTVAPAAVAPAPAAAPPCGAPRAAAPPPCRAQKPPAPKPKVAPPCPKPRAAPKPKPRPPPPPTPPPQPPPCAKPRANPTTPSPCAPAPPPPPPPKQQADPNLETISSNFMLNFNFNRSPATAAPANADAEDEAEAEPEQEQTPPIAPIAIEPRAAKLPPAEPRKPRVYVDAFLVRNGVAQKVNTLDANQFDPQRATDEDYLAYDDDNEQAQYDDYEDAQESRDRGKAVQEFGAAVDQFWQKKKQQRRPQPQKLAPNHYKSVHFGDRDLASQVRLQSLQRERSHPNRIPLPQPEAEDDAEVTTTTEDPKRPLRPRVLPPTEHNPNQIDTVTVRVPPIYKEKRPKKLHRERPVERDRDSTEADDDAEFDIRKEERELDTDSDDSWLTPRTEAPVKRKRRRKNRKTRSAEESSEYTAGDYDYYGKKLPVSEEEKYYMQLTVPTPTKDADLARLEAPQDGHSLNDHERIKDDPERLKEDPQRADENESSEEKVRADDSERADDTGRGDEHERADERERSVDTERASNKGRADERERTDNLSPNARVHETGYQNNYVHATNVQVDNPHPVVTTVKRKTVNTGKP